LAIGPTPARYVLGVDGGGSKTACLASDEQGRFLGYGCSGPTNTNYVTRREAEAALESAIGGALSGAGLHNHQIALLCISAPMEPGALVEAAHACGIERFVRAAEGETPRWAARFWIHQRVGVTVDAGTGSLARGWSTDGRTASAGGWGTTLGDEGSGYWIGMRAMSAVLQACDGRIAETVLSSAALEHFGLADELDLVFRATQGLVRPETDGAIGVGPDSGAEDALGDSADGGLRFRRRLPPRAMTRDEVASLCPVVARAARRRDSAAVNILNEAGVELGRLGTAVIRRLGMEQDAFAAVPFGGVFRIGEPVLGSFRETILAAAPDATVVLPRFEPVVGAVLLALHEIGVEIDAEVIAALEGSSAGFPGVCYLSDTKYSRLSVECARLDARYEQALAEEGMGEERAVGPEY
jgi:N-acetylglucosamine kinase-like BadF-type ATPase